jgi:hypothetical protein
MPFLKISGQDRVRGQMNVDGLQRLTPIALGVRKY